MPKPFFIVSLMILCITILPATLFAQNAGSSQNKEFIDYQKRFDDRAGVLNELELGLIKSAAEQQDEEYGLRAYVLIMPSIPQWNYAEFGRDQFEHWQSQGIVDARSYVIMVSVDDKKSQILRGSYIDKFENDYELVRLRNFFYADMHEGRYGRAIQGYIAGLSQLPTLKKSIQEDKKRSQYSGYLMAAGVLILVLTFVRMGIIRKRRELAREEEKRKSGPYIE